jgi:hypothetical protein
MASGPADDPKILCPKDRTELRPLAWHAPGTLPHFWCTTCVGVFSVNPNTPNMNKREVELIVCEDQAHFVQDFEALPVLR